MFPPLSSTGANTRLKFVNEAVENLADHPQHFLDGHQNSFKHITQSNTKVLFCSIADSNLTPLLDKRLNFGYYIIRHLMNII